MSGLVATPPTANTPITNDAWWPALNTAAARDALRLDGTVSESRLRTALVMAMISVNDQLESFRAAQQPAYASLEKVPAPEIDGTSRYVALYRRAVYCIAHADLLEHYSNLDTTDRGQRDVDEQTPIIDQQRRNARWAISDFMGLGRTTVELI